MQHISRTLFQLRGKLSDIEALVQPRLLQQSLVRSTLDDTPLLHDQNLVRSLYRREAVSDGYHGSPFDQFLQGCLNEPFYLRVERTGGFGDSIADILVQTRVEEEEFLGDNCQAAAQIVLRNILQRDAIEPDGPTRGIIKARSQREEGRFACPARAYQRGELTKRSGEGDIVQHLFIACLSGITETDLFKDETLSWSRGKRLRCGRFRHAGRDFKVLEDAVEQGQPSQQGRVGSRQ